MKRTLFLALAALSILGTAQAETSESNIVVQIKRFIQQPETTAPNGTVTNKYSTVTFKTADVIQQIGIAKAVSFSDKAKLLAIITTTETTIGFTFVIRDGNTDTDVKDCIQLSYAPPVEGGESAVTQFKGTKLPMIGNMKLFGYGTFKLIPNGTNIRMELHGSLINTQRFIPSKEFPGTSFPIFSISHSGTGSFSLPPVNSQPNLGAAQGTIKITGTKIVKTN